MTDGQMLISGVSSAETTTGPTSADSAAVNSAARPGYSNSDRLYGRAPIGLDEVLDTIDEFAQTAGASILITRINPQGQQSNLAPINCADFDASRLVQTYGGGEYRARIMVPGRRGSAKAFKFIMESAAPTLGSAAPIAASSAATPAQPHALDPGMLFAQAMQMQTSMMTMMQQQANTAQQQMQTMLIAMLDKKDKPQGVNDLSALIELADKIAERRGGDGGTIEQVVSGLAAGFLSAKHSAPDATATRPAANPPRVTQINQPALTGPTDTHSRGAGPAAVEQSSAPPQQPATTTETTSMLTLTIGEKFRAGHALTVLEQTLATPNPKPIEIAEILDDCLGEDLAMKILELPEGQVPAELIKYRPALAPREAILLEIEKALRAGYVEEDEEVEPTP